jgi:hypothetical protein
MTRFLANEDYRSRLFCVTNLEIFQTDTVKPSLLLKSPELWFPKVWFVTRIRFQDGQYVGPEN